MQGHENAIITYFYRAIARGEQDLKNFTLCFLNN